MILPENSDIDVEIDDIPSDMVENDDGSVDLVDVEALDEQSGFFDNLALTLGKELKVLASEYVELCEKDKEARSKRDQQYEEGIRRTGMGDDAPGGAEFEGASRVVHPVLAEGCIDFSARAIKELFPPQGPVKTFIVGDANPEQLDRADRKRQYMNWQLTDQMSEYRSELEQLLTQLPLGGSQYQKFWFDEKLARPVSEFVPIDEILLPFSASGFYSSPRVTHRQLITKYEFKRRTKSGLYKTPDEMGEDSSTPSRSLSSVANDKIEGRDEDAYNEDGLRAVLEIYTWLEIGDSLTDGESAPYIFTIDEYTEEVLACYRNWEEGDTRMEKLDWLVEWKFIPWRGAYAIGLPHLIGGLSAALTGSLRALLDSAHINNAATMLKLKSGRITGQSTSVDVTQVCEIEGPAGIDDIRKIAMAMPFNPPSPVLASLMESLYGLAKGMISTTEDQLANINGQTPVGTTMALIESGSSTYSAIHARLHESQKRAFKILSRINYTWLDEKVEVEELGKMIITREDFRISTDIVPVSDPTIFTEAQRFAQSQGLMQMQQQDAGDPSIPWNKVEIRRRMMKQMRIEGVDELLPPLPKPVTANVISENSAVMTGAPLKADIKQDHMAHIQGHLAFLASPLNLSNPLVPPQALSAMLNHMQEHIMMLQQVTTMQAVQQVMMQAQQMGQQPSEDQVMAQAVQVAEQQLNQQLAQTMQQIGMIQQEIQKKTPPPPMPPEVQATMQIAQMENQRKTQMDQATLANKQAEQQAKQAAEQAAFQMDQMQQQFDQNMAAQQQQLDNQVQQLKQSVELQKNEADNHQRQITDLLKNRDDNDTNYRIAMEKLMQDSQAAMQEGFAALQQEPMPQPVDDLAPQMQQLQQMLDQMGKQQTNDALGAVVQGLQATLEAVHAPRRSVLERGPDGRATSAISTIAE